ncbi:MAG: hypothetical protein ACI8W3_002793 [Myxococcota bacterium]|jgi:hypothetical protein
MKFGSSLKKSFYERPCLDVALDLLDLNLFGAALTARSSLNVLLR